MSPPAPPGRWPPPAPRSWRRPYAPPPRLGLGALGVITELTFAVEPEFLLTAREEPMPFDEVTGRFDELVAENEHFECYWFPHTGNCNTKRNNRSQGPAAPPGRLSGWVE